MTMIFFVILRIVFVDKPRISGGYFVENGKTGRFLTLRTVFWASGGDKAVVVDKNGLPDGGKPITLFRTVLWRIFRIFPFPQGCGEFIHIFQGLFLSKKGDFSQKQGNFGDFHKLSHISLCKTYFFHTVFHNLWKSHGKIHKRDVDHVEKSWDKIQFSTRAQVRHFTIRLSFP